MHHLPSTTYAGTILTWAKVGYTASSWRITVCVCVCVCVCVHHNSAIADQSVLQYIYYIRSLEMKLLRKFL